MKSNVLLIIGSSLKNLYKINYQNTFWLSSNFLKDDLFFDTKKTDSHTKRCNQPYQCHELTIEECVKLRDFLSAHIESSKECLCKRCL